MTVQSMELDMVNESSVVQFMYVGSWAGVTYLLLHSADEPQAVTVAILLFSSCHIGLSKRFSRSIRLAVYCLSLYIFLGQLILSKGEKRNEVNHM